MVALHSWSQIEDGFQASAGLLLGNGFSIMCWPDFQYSSLFVRACEKGFLDADARLLFAALDTDGFEVVLEALRHAVRVARALGEDIRRLEAAEATVRRALFAAVRDVHIPHRSLRAQMGPLARELGRFTAIFTTNYDLIPYWAFMAASASTATTDAERAAVSQSVPDSDAQSQTTQTSIVAPCIDFFHAGQDKNAAALAFSLERVTADLQSPATRLFYLHGGLHLFADGEKVCKVRRQKSADKAADGAGIKAILEWIEREHHEPLLVTEGHAARKRQFIRENPYLDWAFGQFETHPGPLVVFGHSLSLEADGHLLDVMRRWPPGRTVAVSVFPPDLGAMTNAGRLDVALKTFGHQPFFFDCREHPLARALAQAPSQALAQPLSPALDPPAAEAASASPL